MKEKRGKKENPTGAKLEVRNATPVNVSVVAKTNLTTAKKPIVDCRKLSHMQREGSETPEVLMGLCTRQPLFFFFLFYIYGKSNMFLIQHKYI